MTLEKGGTRINWNISSRNLPAHEWIGLDCKVLESADPNKRGLKGKIVDETQHTVLIETAVGEKMFPKKEGILEVRLEEGWTRLETKDWCFRPEDRIKAFFKNKKKKKKMEKMMKNGV